MSDTAVMRPVHGKLAGIRPEDVLQRYLAEETTTQIAESYGVTRSNLNYWLLNHAEEQWKQAQVVKALQRKAEAEDEMDVATDAFTLARARERLKAAQWDLERVCRRIYGDTGQQASVSAEGLADLLMAVSERMLKEKQIAAIPHAAQQSSTQDDNTR